MEKRLDAIEDSIKTLFTKYNDLSTNLRIISSTSAEVSQKVSDMSIILEKLNKYLSPDLEKHRPGVVMQTEYNLQDIKKQAERTDGAFHRIDELRNKQRDISVKFTAWEILVKDVTIKLDKFKPVNTPAVVGMVTIATGILGALMVFLK